MRKQLSITLAVSFILTACGGGSHTAAPAPVPGWVIDLRDGDTPPVMPAVEALAWRYQDYEDKTTTDIWIAAAKLTEQQRSQFLPRRNGQSHDEATQADTLGLTGLLIRVDDSGNGSHQMLNFCVPAEQKLKCSGGSGLGMALVSRFDTQSIAGEYYTRAPDGTLHAASFDAPLRNESTTPMPANVSFSKDGGEVGAAWLADNEAALKGDVAALKRAAMPDRAADYDDPQVLKIVQRMAMQKPGILSARLQDDQALLWVRDGVISGSMSPGVQRVSMQKLEGQWRIVETRTN